MRAKRKGRGRVNPRVKAVRGQADQRTSGPQLHQTTSWPSICPAEVAAWPRFRLVIFAAWPPGKPSSTSPAIQKPSSTAFKRNLVAAGIPTSACKSSGPPTVSKASNTRWCKHSSTTTLATSISKNSKNYANSVWPKIRMLPKSGSSARRPAGPAASVRKHSRATRSALYRSVPCEPFVLIPPLTHKYQHARPRRPQDRFSGSFW